MSIALQEREEDFQPTSMTRGKYFTAMFYFIAHWLRENFEVSLFSFFFSFFSFLFLSFFYQGSGVLYFFVRRRITRKKKPIRRDAVWTKGDSEGVVRFVGPRC